MQTLVDELKTTALPTATTVERFSANNATWLFIRKPLQLKPEEQEELELIYQRSQTARKTYELTQQFMALLRQRRGQDFEAWGEAVETSHLPELQRFVHGLLKDKEAVVAGLMLSYSNDHVA